MQNKLEGIRNFIVYDGARRIDYLTGYDIAIVEPLAHRSEEIEALKKKGTLTLAYLSVMELPVYHGKFELMQKEILRINNNLIINKEFGNYYMDLESVKWIESLKGQANDYLGNQKYDGLFLDTVGNIENPAIPPSTMFLQTRAYVVFLKTIKDRFPKCILVQNNGIERIIHYTKKIVDGICRENPPLKNVNSKWSKMTMKRLNFLQSKEGIRVFLLSDIESYSETIKEIASKYNFLYYIAD